MTENQSARRTIRILEYLANENKPRGLSKISHDLDINKSTLYRFLSTLMREGYVHQESETGNYYLGLKIAWLSAKILEGNDIRSHAKSSLEELARKTCEHVHLGVLDQYEVVYIDKVPGTQAVQMRSRIGYRSPLHSSALGKIILSNMPESKWQEYVDKIGLEPRTHSTITDPNTFYNHLRKAQIQNFCVDNMENEEGIRCVASPLRDHTGNVIAAVSVSGSTLTMTMEKVDNILPLLLEKALLISQSLGFNNHE